MTYLPDLGAPFLPCVALYVTFDRPVKTVVPSVMSMRRLTFTPSLEVVTSVKPARPSSSRNVPLLPKVNEVGLPPAVEVLFRASDHLLSGGVCPDGSVKLNTGVPFGALTLPFVVL